ncbi:MAG: GTP 3',8-cyclase MoaA [Gallionella sp.]
MSTQLIDSFCREIEYVRISVTDRCDLRCSYCMPEGCKDFEQPANWLSIAEIERMVGLFAQMGVGRFRLTGGEPLLRSNLSELIRRMHALPGVQDISLSTNATQLAKHAGDLKQSGLNRINVSLDSLRKERLISIVGRDVLEQIMAGLFAAKSEGLAPIKINMVAMRGVNDDEFDAMVDFCMTHGFILRFIETMPMGYTGRNAQYLNLQPVKQHLRERFNLVESVYPGGGPARYLQSADGSFNVGFITPISQHFCETCNRVRLSVDGTLYMCLGQEAKLELRPLLRAGASDAEIEVAIRQAIELKPERHEFKEKPHKIVRFMSATGG